MVKKGNKPIEGNLDSIGVTVTEITGNVREPGTKDVGYEETINPETFTSSFIGSNDSTGSGDTGTTEEIKRGRGRPPGSTQKTSKANIESLASLLSVIHFSLAAVTNCTDLILSEDESERLAKASADVAKHYDLGFTDKQKDILAFAICAGSIYAPKIRSIVTSKKKVN